MDFQSYVPSGRLPPLEISPLQPLNPDGYLPSRPRRGGGFGLGGDEMARWEMAEPREGITQELSQRRLLEDEVRRELALERTSANRMRGMDVIPPPLGIAEPIDPLLLRYTSIPDAGIGHFSRQNKPPVPLYPSLPDAGIGQFGRQLDPPVPMYPSLISERPDLPVPRYTSIPDATIDQLGRRLDYGQSLELVRGPEFSRGPEFGQSLELVRGLLGPGPEFGRSLGLGQGEIWRAAAPSLLPPYDRAKMIEMPPVMHQPPLSRKVNASSLPVVGGMGRTTTRTEIIPGSAATVVGGKRRTTRTEIVPESVATEWSCALCKVSTTSQLDLDFHLQGKKHLAIAEMVNADKASLNDDIGGKRIATTRTEIVPESVATRWRCALCKVSTTSQLDLDFHLRGKKHLANVEKENADNASQDDETASPPKKSTKAAEESSGKRSEVESSSDSDKEAPRDMLECELCQVTCPNLRSLNAHLTGRKHRMCLEMSKVAGGLEKVSKFTDRERKRPRKTT